MKKYQLSLSKCHFHVPSKIRSLMPFIFVLGLSEKKIISIIIIIIIIFIEEINVTNK